jgi:hypothetical protein
MDKKITPSDLRSEAQRLIAAGKMPSLEEVLGTVANTRKKYTPQIKEAQKSNLEE